MFLKKLIMVNWGNLPNGEFEFGPINLFSGGNGSGKTTAADMIQTIMTAAHENLFQYNPGQDETTQKGRGGKKVRTLASYILGCDDGSYSRLNPTDGYMAASFYPTEGEVGEPFTAMLGVRAWLENAGNNRLARQEELVFYILTQQQNRSLELSDLQPNNSVLTLDNLHNSLISLFGKSAVEKYDTKRAYLRRLYGVLRGKKDAVTDAEAMGAAKAFSRFMAYKPVQSINRFVADEILEKKDLGEAVRSISSQLKTIHGMEKDAGKIQESVDVLQGAATYSQNYLETWRDFKLKKYTLAKHHYLIRQKDYVTAKDKEKQIKNQLSEIDQNIEINTQRVEQLHQQRISLEAQRMGVAALQEKDELEKKRDRESQALALKAQRLLMESQQLDGNLQATKQIIKLIQSPNIQTELPMLAELKTLTSAKKVVTGASDSTFDMHQLMGKDLLNDIQGLEKQLDEINKIQNQNNNWVEHWEEFDDQRKSLKVTVDNYLDRLEQNFQQLAKERQHKESIVDRLEQKQVVYPDYVNKAIAAIENMCPKADPRVLCDHVEVVDDKWQAAIEGYLGGARYSIIVDEDYEAEAIRIVRGLPGRANKARIIQAYKAQRDAQRMTLDKDSIIHLMDFTHATAKNYLIASYGSVLQVTDEHELRTTRRGLTVDCIASGNYALFRCDISESELVFGVEARQKAFLGQQYELQKLTERWNQINERMLDVKELVGWIGKLKKVALAEPLSETLACHRELQKIENLLSHIDLSDHQELEKKLLDLTNEEKVRREEGDKLIEERGKLKGRLESLVKSFTKLSNEQEETLELVDACEAELNKLQSSWSSFDLDKYLDTADSQANSLNANSAESEIQEIETTLFKLEKQLDDSIKNHNQICQPGDALIYDAFNGEFDLKLFNSIIKLQRQLDNIYNRLKNNILLEKHQQLKQLKESFNHTFVTNLCHSIHQAINDGKRQIDLLNQELTNHKFGDDRETFRFDYEWVPEYKEYAKFFEDVIKHPDLTEGQTLFDVKLTKKSIEVRDRLMSMLLEEDSDKALRELGRIADYRNYRQYEIYKEVEGKPPIALSEYGTGSGGQLETPAYIIRAAAITSAFRFAEGRCHLRTVLVDEAFSKMDETRSREVINYLTESLGLQLVFIMPTSKCGPFMDLISNEFVFAKVPSPAKRGELSTRVLVDRKVCNTERIKDLWANHKRTVYRQAELDFLAELEAIEDEEPEIAMP
ncbi:ATP-binding protein [Aliikangiella sp. G2MR2-5]|uniref:ATP-binding protein n=1 Tax=Aliikangiella sp. G2MR2-5 TaxID=2788943 RepID=UPI0018AC35BA|nr:SbcC/MukB-like Walker B domain-containing protein [Aliikangiella sp. G2MR2-5]